MATRIQFSIRSILIVTAFVCLLASALTLQPSGYTGIIVWIVSASLPISFALGVIHGRQYTQAFCVGAFLPSFVVFRVLFSSLMMDLPPVNARIWTMVIEEHATEARQMMAFGWAASLVTGCLALAIYGLSKRLMNR
jgi:hypothetical protein